MRKKSYAVLIAVFALLLVLSFYVFFGDILNNPGQKKTISNKNSAGEINPEKNASFRNSPNLNNNSIFEDNISNSGASAGGGSGSGGAGGSSSSGSNEVPDANQQPCGYYYADYGICNGTCPKGTCVNEKRSCYCKED